MSGDAKLPIAAYDPEAVQPECDWCYADDVHGLVDEHRENVQAARVSLAQEIAGVLRARGHWTPDVHAQPSDVISAVGAALAQESGRAEKAEAQSAFMRKQYDIQHDRADKAEAQRDRLAHLFGKAWGPGCSERAADCPACEVEAEFREITGHGFAEIEEGGEG